MATINTGGFFFNSGDAVILNIQATEASPHSRVLVDRTGADNAGLHVTGATTLGAASYDTTANRMLHVGGDTHIEGNLSITGTLERGTTTETTLQVEDKYIIANHSAGTTTQDGGMLVQLMTPVNQVSNTGAANTLGTHAGIRFDESTMNWQTSIGTTNIGGVDGDWVNIGSGTLSSVSVNTGSGLSIGGNGNVTVSMGNADFDVLSNSEFVTTALTASGGSNMAAKTGGSHLALNTTADSTGGGRGLATATATNYILAANIAQPGQLTWIAEDGSGGEVNKFEMDFDKALNATGNARDIIIAAGSSGHNLAGTDFTVKVYEGIDASGDPVASGSVAWNEIIPDRVVVSTAAGTLLGQTRAIGDIIIRFPENTPRIVGRIVIKG